MNVCILLGNGFTIDFSKFIKNPFMDVTNLFSKGDRVPWPGDNIPGFLSYKHCPNLWNLGVHSDIDSERGIAITEDIISCANMQNENHKTQTTTSKIYLRAYKELVQYLLALFIYYNGLISDEKLKGAKKWKWIKYIKKLYDKTDVEHIFIITLNYDIWLERLLKQLGIDFNIAGFENRNDKKIQIFKPHGSISFQSKSQNDPIAYDINYSFDLLNDSPDQFDIRYENLTCLGMLNAMVPPAGDSRRWHGLWASKVRKEIENALQIMNENDEIIICGISYWHVDRAEIDGYLTKIPSSISNVMVINPAQPHSFNAVLTTYFDNVINFTSIDNFIQK